MKKLFKNLSKIFSIALVIAISFITLTACSDENKQASVTPTTQTISDTTSTEEKDTVVDAVSDTTEEAPQDVETISPSAGVYKFSDLSLGYDDIYFEGEEELFTFFKTRDLNGVYDIIHKLGFSDFTANLTSYISEYERAFALAKGLNDDTYYLTNLFISNIDAFTSTNENEGIDLVLNSEENTLAASDDIIKIIQDQESNKYYILYSFNYIDSETNEVVYSPLYVKAEIYNYIAIDSDEISANSLFAFVEESAHFESSNGLIDSDASMQKLAELFQNGETDAIETLSNLIVLVNNDMTKLYMGYNDTLIFATLVNANTNTFSIYNSFNIRIANEIYDITTNTYIINVEIDLDATTTFKCSFVSLTSIIA